MKQNTNVMVELFYSLLVVLFVVFLAVVIPNINLYLGILGTMLLAINFGLNNHINNSSRKLFERLY